MNIYDEIKTERNRQEWDWGVRDHDPSKWLIIAGEEYGEACRAVLESSLLQYREELVHLAAVCVAAIESMHRQAERGVNDGEGQSEQRKDCRG